MVTRMKFALILMGVALTAMTFGQMALADTTVGNDIPNISYFVNTGELSFYDDGQGVDILLLNGPQPAVTGQVDWLDAYGGGVDPLPGAMPGPDGGLWDVRYANEAQQYLNLGGIETGLGVPPDACGAGCAEDVFGSYILADYGLGLVSADFSGADYGGFADNAMASTSIDFSLSGDYDGSGLVGGGDLALVLNNWGDDVDVTGIPMGWVNHFPSGLIGGGELAGVLGSWGDEFIDFPPAAVPEPASALLLLVAAAGLLRRR